MLKIADEQEWKKKDEKKIMKGIETTFPLLNQLSFSKMKQEIITIRRDGLKAFVTSFLSDYKIMWEALFSSSVGFNLFFPSTIRAKGRWWEQK